MILAVDYGARFVGLALASPPETPVHRAGVIDQSVDDVMQELRGVIEKEKVTLVLVGVPMGFSGSETEQTHLNLKFIESLRETLDPAIEIEGVDETLTSSEADRVIMSEGASGQDQHAEAARLLLVDYLEQSRDNL